MEIPWHASATSCVHVGRHSWAPPIGINMPRRVPATPHPSRVRWVNSLRPSVEKSASAGHQAGNRDVQRLIGAVVEDHIGASGSETRTLDSRAAPD
jgi:hypothetical protein